MSPPSSPVRSKEVVECSGLCQCPVWLGLGGGLRGNSGILPAMPSFSVRTSKPVENFYKNLSQIEDLEARSEQFEMKCFQEMIVCSSFFAFKISACVWGNIKKIMRRWEKAR